MIKIIANFTLLKNMSKRSAETLSVMPFFLMFFITLLSVSRGIAGPFVFGDEAEYRGMIYSLYTHFSLSGHRQYGPLYPLLVSGFEYLWSPQNIYSVVKSLNISIACVAFFLFWGISKHLLGGTRLFWPAILGFVLAPFWSYTIVTWADPLFYCLFYCSVFLLLYAQNRLTTDFNGNYFFYPGLVAGLLFLAKPATIVYGASMIVAYVVAYHQKLFLDRSYRRGLVALFLGWGVVIAPYIIRNMFFEHTSALGYSYVGELLRELIYTHTYLYIFKLYFLSIAYHFSYLLMASFGSAFTVIYFLIRAWKGISPEDRFFILYPVVALLLICLVSAVHMMLFPPDGYRVPNGRYLTHFVPLFFVIIFYLYDKYIKKIIVEMTLRQRMFFLAAPLLVFLASPMYVLGAFMIVNGPDLAPYFLMFEGKRIPWRARFSPDVYQQALPALVVLIGIIPFFFRRLYPVIGAGMLLVAGVMMCCGMHHQTWLIRTMANTQKQFNKLFIHSISGRFSLDICNKHVYFDSSLEKSNIPFMFGYWCPANTIQYLNTVNISKQWTPDYRISGKGYLVTQNKFTNLPAVISDVDGFSVFKI